MPSVVKITKPLSRQQISNCPKHSASPSWGPWCHFRSQSAHWYRESKAILRSFRYFTFWKLLAAPTIYLLFNFFTKEAQSLRDKGLLLKIECNIYQGYGKQWELWQLICSVCEKSFWSNIFGFKEILINVSFGRYQL